ncbi:hypothetical protein FRC03_007861 [Tulasnella sp. 419]|nr:hypothetical protein FRC03_007861 [Tulasnella sp. 419]
MSRKPRPENSSLTVPQAHDDNVALLGRRESFTSENKHHSMISRSSSPSNSSISGGHSPTRQSYERHVPQLSYAPPSGAPPNYSPNSYSMSMPAHHNSGSHLQMPSPVSTRYLMVIAMTQVLTETSSFQGYY